MAAVNITNTVTDPSGTAIVGATITATLMPCGGFRADDSEVAPVEATTTNGSGAWTLSLERNDQITPTGTYYEVVESLGSPHGNRVWAIQVNAAGNLHDSLVVAPTAQPSLLSAVQSLDSSLYGATATNVLLGGDSDDGAALTVSRSDHVHALRTPALFRTGMTYSHSFSGAAFTSIDFDDAGTTQYNYGGFVISNANITLPVAGVYLFGAKVKWPSNATGTRGLRIVGTTAGTLEEDTRTTDPSNAFSQKVTTPGLMTTENVAVSVQQNSGTTLAITEIQFWAVLIARTYT